MGRPVVVLPILWMGFSTFDILRLFIIDDVLDLWGQPGHLLLVSSSYGHVLGGSSAETLKIGSITSKTLNSTEYVQPMFKHYTAKRNDLVYIILGHFVLVNNVTWPSAYIWSVMEFDNLLCYPSSATRVFCSSASFFCSSRKCSSSITSSSVLLLLFCMIFHLFPHW